MSLNELFDQAKETAWKRGFYDDLKGFDALLAPLLSEIEELKEAYYKGDHKGFQDEFADVIISAGSIGRFLELDLDHIVVKKMAYNEIRKDKAKI